MSPIDLPIDRNRLPHLCRRAQAGTRNACPLSRHPAGTPEHPDASFIMAADLTPAFVSLGLPGTVTLTTP